MSAVLGVSAHYHDSAAALAIDGRIVAAVQEERLSRVKHDPSFPGRAIAACLALAGIEGRALDSVVFYENPYAKLERVLVALVREFPHSFRAFPRALASQLGEKLWILDRLASATGVDRRRVGHAMHHESHAASAFYPSGFEDAAILTVDGVGEEATTGIWRGKGETLECLETVAFPHSLGLFYAAFTAWLGFEVNDGEYKVMGLASYGRPRFRDEVADVLRVASDGSYELALHYFGRHADPDLGFCAALERLFGPRRDPRRRWSLDHPEDRRCADVAASVQLGLEEALLALARRARESTGATRLCLAGGVALNAVANARLLAEGGFERVFVQPAAGDAGGAIGAALIGASRNGDRVNRRIESVALGVGLDRDRAARTAHALGLRVRDLEPDELAVRIAAGSIVGLASGRMEFGPRALGQRSILADPREAATRDRLNRAIKKREPFRPFAPAVLADVARRFFDRVDPDMAPFMTTVSQVKANAGLGAVTHVDGTARVQTVDRDQATALAAVLRALDTRGLPVVLNTSLNGPGEPICASEIDVLAFFEAHPIDGLTVEDLWIERPG
jgi:carbamoyltransferase